MKIIFCLSGIFVLFIALCEDAFSQDFRDSIITKSDTILCKITLINKKNIFYTSQIDNKKIDSYISLTEIVSYKKDTSLDANYTAGNPNTIESAFIHKFDSTENWIVGLKCNVQVNNPLGQTALLFSIYKQNHNFHIGPEYIQLFSNPLYGDSDYDWETQYVGLNFGYRYFPKSNSKSIFYYFGLNYSIFEGKYIEVQRGPPFQTEHSPTVVLSTGCFGISYKISKNFNIYSNLGLTSMSNFFLLINNSSMNVTFGLEYRFIK